MKATAKKTKKQSKTKKATPRPSLEVAGYEAKAFADAVIAAQFNMANIAAMYANACSSKRIDA